MSSTHPPSVIKTTNRVTLPPEMELLASNFWETSSGCVTGKGVLGSDIRGGGATQFLPSCQGTMIAIWFLSVQTLTNQRPVFRSRDLYGLIRG